MPGGLSARYSTRIGQKEDFSRAPEVGREVDGNGREGEERGLK
jgi:hypothetical protein